MTRMASLTLGLVVALGTSTGAQPQMPPMPAELRAHLRVERFAPITSVAGLPPAVRTELASMFQEGALRMAEPEAPFQATDAVLDPSLPFHRLIAAGCSADHCLVYYEKGGFAHLYEIVVLAKKGDKARLEWGGQAEGGLAGLEGAKAALVSGKVFRQNNYW